MRANTGKNRPEKNLYLDTFHQMFTLKIMNFSQLKNHMPELKPFNENFYFSYWAHFSEVYLGRC